MSPAFGRLQHIVVSGEVGLLKPDPRIFALTAERAGLAPSELLFVDDSRAQHDAAAAALASTSTGSTTLRRWRRRWRRAGCCEPAAAPLGSARFPSRFK